MRRGIGGGPGLPHRGTDARESAVELLAPPATGDPVLLGDRRHGPQRAGGGGDGSSGMAGRKPVTSANRSIRARRPSSIRLRSERVNAMTGRVRSSAACRPVKPKPSLSARRASTGDSASRMAAITPSRSSQARRIASASSQDRPMSSPGSNHPPTARAAPTTTPLLVDEPHIRPLRSAGILRPPALPWRFQDQHYAETSGSACGRPHVTHLSARGGRSDQCRWRDDRTLRIDRGPRRDRCVGSEACAKP